MKLFTGKRIGQSGQELALSVFFSFIIHIIVLFAVLFLYMKASPEVYVPVAYQVALVEPPTELSAAPPPSPPAPPPAPVPKTNAKEAKASPKKGGMPELASKKQKEEERPVQETGNAEGAAEKREGVAVAAATPAFKFPWYLAIVSDKIRRNWNPPPGARDARARLAFRIYRSGIVSGANLEEGSGNFYFDQAAMRAILASSPFPPLPEGFARESVDISVDLEPKE